MYKAKKKKNEVVQRIPRHPPHSFPYHYSHLTVVNVSQSASIGTCVYHFVGSQPPCSSGPSFPSPRKLCFRSDFSSGVWARCPRLLWQSLSPPCWQVKAATALSLTAALEVPAPLALPFFSMSFLCSWHFTASLKWLPTVSHCSCYIGHAGPESVPALEQAQRWLLSLPPWSPLTWQVLAGPFHLTHF